MFSWFMTNFIVFGEKRNREELGKTFFTRSNIILHTITEWPKTNHTLFETKQSDSDVEGSNMAGLFTHCALCFRRRIYRES